MMRRRHRREDKHFSSDEFDDEFDDIEELLPDEARPLIHEMRPVIDDVAEHVLPSGAITIDTEIGTMLPRGAFVSRVNRHFADDDLGYKPLRGPHDTFKLRVKSARYPWFGAFTGRVHIIEDFGHHAGAHPSIRFYTVTGLLRFRLSVLYCSAVIIGFFLLLWWLSQGFFMTVVFFFFGVGACIGAGYIIGREQRDEVLDRVEESLLRLRATIMNRR